MLINTPSELQAALAVAQHRLSTPKVQTWLAELKAHVLTVQAATYEQFQSIEFQTQLWNSEAIAATGKGSIDVSKVIVNQQIIDHLWGIHTTPLPDDPAERIHFLSHALEELRAMVKPLVSMMPRLKIFRVIAAIKPSEFTTIAFGVALRKLGRRLGMKVGKDAVLVHRNILDKLNEALPPVAPPPHEDGLKRMMLPWLLFKLSGEDLVDEEIQVELEPLPAARRRRGMLAIGGYSESLRTMIEFASDGCTREDFKQHVQTINPNLKSSSISSVINALMGDWGLLQSQGEMLTLTDRGEAFLEDGDPADVSDWLLTRILGFDNVLVRLKSQAATQPELIVFLKAVNPGWTSDFAPRALLNWLRALKLVIQGDDRRYRLTDTGQNWAQRIHWTPQTLESVEVSEVDHLSGPQQGDQPAFSRPNLKQLIQAMPAETPFDPALIARLDAGLWLNARRHFAVLTGLSGAGKTLLARNYGLALWAEQPNAESGIYVLPVQPGWHDPSSLLGYVNPLAENNFVRTGFVDFLLRASNDPERPYTLILDEMNLSHPEQYFAPILSAMETGGEIELHSSDEDMDGIPPNVRYPANLVIIGTVNMDETTHGLSDKVLDRASVIDFWDVEVSDFPGWKDSELPDEILAAVRATLVELSDALYPVRLHFGWRTISDVIGFMQISSKGGVLNWREALDHALYSKVLPKLRGEDTPRLRISLESACEILRKRELKNSANKVKDLLDDLIYSGSARFWR